MLEYISRGIFISHFMMDSFVSLWIPSDSLPTNSVGTEPQGIGTSPNQQ